MTPVQTPADLRPLTSMRFLAAVWVVLFAAWPHLDVSWVPTAVTKGYLGVEVFFVLSGFILSHVYLEAVGRKGFSYSGFLWARIARVYPLHLATLFGMIALGVAATAAGMQVAEGLTDWRSLPAHLTMTQAWGLAPSAAFNHPSWSISAEWFAYLSFPLYAWATWRLRGRPWLAVGLATALALALYAVFEPLAGHSLTIATFRWGALRIVPCFALGCALYLVHRRGPLPKSGWIALAGAVGLVVSASLGLWDPIMVLFAGVIILALGSFDNARSGLLASPLGVYLGEVSYSVYMVNAPVLLLMTNVLGRVLGESHGKLAWPVWLIAVGAILPTAMITYHLIEKPARKAMRGWADGRKTATKPRTVAA